MQLPFTHDQFLAVFAAYNAVWWPVAATLWVLTAGAVALLYKRRDSGSSRLLAAVLAIQWAWAGAVYHMMYFRPINPIAIWFGIGFLVEAVLLLWLGALRPHFAFAPSASPWALFGGALIAYGLLYPATVLLTGLRYPYAPTFGVPCPTAILTTGALLLVPRRAARAVSIIPILWSAVGGSAAYHLSMRADAMLLVAGAALVIYILTPEPKEATVVA